MEDIFEDVFISYHRSKGTSELVSRISEELTSMGISCWYDNQAPAPGYFVLRIQQKIQHCKIFLLIWDEGSNNSEWCLSETYTAFDSDNHPIRIPFKLGKETFQENAEMGFYMNRCQKFYGSGSPENADIQEIVAQIAKILLN